MWRGRRTTPGTAIRTRDGPAAYRLLALRSRRHRVHRATGEALVERRPGAGGSVAEKREMEFPVTAQAWEVGLGQAPRADPGAAEPSQERE
ncbi:MAG: hypothetical protein QOF40_3232 [Actinomycetota bacterium]|nr:hypothetical protein [Actinomycetota bacterium]